MDKRSPKHEGMRHLMGQEFFQTVKKISSSMSLTSLEKHYRRIVKDVNKKR